MSQHRVRVNTMHHIYRVLGIVVVSFGFASAPASGCSMVIGPRFSLSPDSPIFVGRVGDYLEPISMDGCLPGEIYPGFIVSLETVLGGPTFKGLRVELYPYGLSASCGPRPLRMDELKSQYPPGAKIRVVAESGNPCRGAELPKQNGTVRLFAPVFLGGISQVAPSDPDPAASEPFDYLGFVSTRQQMRGDAADFEVVKDLLRLARAGTESERATILTRLMVLPDYRGPWCEGLVNANIHSESEAQRLTERCRVLIPEVHQ